ncbi:MAG: bifunctional methylenetetrahydrofolate dehydrogenase/methenyltetrahydrofolate cyclohydrolase FolD [Nitrospirota bacterium]|nr:bifunctional methylenetetrahydrofolate dehydrogenase/methenyltetrahydrofolate cyclohydrolase FolD [Nitrospirota bacterium]
MTQATGSGTAAQIIDGKAISTQMKEAMKAEVVALEAKGIKPGLAVVLVGENPASVVYVRNKGKACTEVGIHSVEHKIPAETTEAQLLSLIDQLNNDPKINGILVQLPLPKHINEKRVLDAISPTKDVDGFHPFNVGKLAVGEALFPPCTPFGVIKMIEHAGVSMEGKNAVVVGRSNIVGKPVALMLLQKNATVTITHSKTKNLKEVCREADILVAAIGKANFVTADMVKPGAVVIDVGINRLDDGKLVGDVDYAPCAEVAGWITPVPGGVGPMTITMLLYNTINSAKRANGMVAETGL